ncbi:MAG: pseudaminic acid synthase [Proteobacteria bacterium]|nr:pseudaminic acid synthase [Pseudomonadota bacterium]
MKIGNRSISAKDEPFIVAELSGNHGGSLSRAKEIVSKCVDEGVHAIKLQTYTADTITIDSDSPDFIINNPKSLWNKRRLYELYQEASTPWEWHEDLFKLATDAGLYAFSSAFDETSVDFLESLNVPCYKVASFEITHIPLLKKIRSTNKPVILSTGMANDQEIKNALEIFKGREDVMILKCTSNYPAKPEEMNLKTILDMKEKFGVEVGLSEHTVGINVALASIVLGAVMIEKHVTLTQSDDFVDSKFSLTPEQFGNLVKESKNIWKSLGSIHYGPSSSDEQKSLIFRRSIYVVKDVKKGDKLTTENIRVIRPSLGLSPDQYEVVLGKVAAHDIKAGTALSRDHIQ